MFRGVFCRLGAAWRVFWDGENRGLMNRDPRLGDGSRVSRLIVLRMKMEQRLTAAVIAKKHDRERVMSSRAMRVFNAIKAEMPPCTCEHCKPKTSTPETNEGESLAAFLKSMGIKVAGVQVVNLGAAPIAMKSEGELDALVEKMKRRAGSN